MLHAALMKRDGDEKIMFRNRSAFKVDIHKMNWLKIEKFRASQVRYNTLECSNPFTFVVIVYWQYSTAIICQLMLVSIYGGPNNADTTLI